jgi:hypothetical protein
MSDMSQQRCRVCGEDEYACACEEPRDWTCDMWQARCQELADRIEELEILLARRQSA